jgi:hypothetical protein
VIVQVYYPTGWVDAQVTAKNGGSWVVQPVTGTFPDGSTRRVLQLPMDNRIWRY